MVRPAHPLRPWASPAADARLASTSSLDVGRSTSSPGPMLGHRVDWPTCPPWYADGAGRHPARVRALGACRCRTIHILAVGRPVRDRAAPEVRAAGMVASAAQPVPRGPCCAVLTSAGPRWSRTAISASRTVSPRPPARRAEGGCCSARTPASWRVSRWSPPRKELVPLPACFSSGSSTARPSFTTAPEEPGRLTIQRPAVPAPA